MPRTDPILIEVKYRENSEIKADDAIVVMGKADLPGLVITKNESDFGLLNMKMEKRFIEFPHVHSYIY